MKIHLGKDRADCTFDEFKQWTAPLFKSVPAKRREKEVKEWYTKLTGREAREDNPEIEELPSTDRPEDFGGSQKKRKRTNRSDNE